MKIKLTIFSAALSLMVGVSHHAAAQTSPPPGAVKIGSDFTKVAISAFTPWTVHYGVAGNWISLTGAGMSPIQCEPATFGKDPAPNVAKSCFLSGAPKEATVEACAADFQQCTHSGKGTVLYGVYGKMVWKKVASAGQLACQPSTFGVDPAPNVPKNCFFFPSTADNIGIRISMSAYSGYSTSMCLSASATEGAVINPHGACSADSNWSIIDGRLTRVTPQGNLTGYCAHREPIGSTGSFNLVMKACALDQASSGAQRGWVLPADLNPAFMPIVFKFSNETFCMTTLFGRAAVVNCDPAKKNLVTKEMYVDVTKVFDLP